MSAKVARVRRSRYLALGIREWGMPTSAYPGRAWRFGPDDAPRMSVIVAHGPDRVRIETADVVFVDDDHGAERFPPGWRDAFAHAVRRSPWSSGEIAAWARLSHRARIRLALRVLSADMPGKPRDKIGEEGRRRVAAAILAVTDHW